MADLNLLIRRRGRKVFLPELVGVSRTLSLISALLFFVTSSILVFVIVYNQFSIDSLRKRGKELEGDLRSFLDVESKSYFIKDRASKALSIFDSRTSVERLDDLQLVLESVGFYDLEKAEVDNKSLSFTLIAKDYRGVYNFMSFVRQGLSYRNIVLESLSFDPNRGYIIDVLLEI